MAWSQMRERVRVFAYPTSPILDEGVPRNAYAMVPSGEPDGAYWMSRGVPSGRDVTMAAQRSQKADAVFCCLEHAPVKPNGLLRDLSDGRLYLVTSINRAPRAGQFVINAEFADDAKYVTVGEP